VTFSNYGLTMLPGRNHRQIIMSLNKKHKLHINYGHGSIDPNSKIYVFSITSKISEEHVIVRCT